MSEDIRKRFQEKDEERKEAQRTVRQNSALHVLFRLLADELNDAGLDQRKVLKPGVSIPWTDKAIKENIWKPVQKAQLNKGSTTQLSTKEIDAVFDTINRHMGEKFGLHVPFPSIETILDKEREAQR